MLLNGEIEREKAASYSSLARVVSQTVSSEITRARFVKESPDLGLDEDVFEEEEEDRIAPDIVRGGEEGGEK